MEGFAGSAAQTAALHGSLFSSLSQQTGVVLVHALNPYGFAHISRFNENNVDLNRNFRDWSEPLPPPHPDTKQLTRIILSDETDPRLADYIEANGRSHYETVLTKGQYQFAKGLCYGGRKASWSNQVWHRVLRPFSSTVDTVYHLDLHSGYGQRGQATILSSAPATASLGQWALDVWGDAVVAPDAHSLSAAAGCIEESLPRIFNRAKVLTATIEIGTRAFSEVVDSLVTANRCLHGAASFCTDNQKQAVRDNLRESYAPHDPIWQKSAVTAYLACMEQAVARIARTDSKNRRPFCGQA